jgi:hypothetical protein
MNLIQKLSFFKKLSFWLNDFIGSGVQKLSEAVFCILQKSVDRKFSRNTRICSLGIDKSQAFSADLSIHRERSGGIFDLLKMQKFHFCTPDYWRDKK